MGYLLFIILVPLIYLYLGVSDREPESNKPLYSEGFES
jgi:hypothetical protein